MDLDGLREFAFANDQEARPYFFGRTKIMDGIEAATTLCWCALRNGSGGLCKSRLVPETRRIHPEDEPGKGVMIDLDTNLSDVARSFQSGRTSLSFGIARHGCIVVRLIDPTDFVCSENSETHGGCGSGVAYQGRTGNTPGAMMA